MARKKFGEDYKERLIYKKIPRYVKKTRQARVVCTLPEEEICYEFLIDVRGLEEFIKNYKQTARGDTGGRNEIKRSSLHEQHETLHLLCSWYKGI